MGSRCVEIANGELSLDAKAADPRGADMTNFPCVTRKSQGISPNA